MRSSNQKEGILAGGRIAKNSGVGRFTRFLFAFIGLLAGNAVLLLYFLLNAIVLRAALLRAHMGEPARVIPQAWEMFILYSISSIIGWALVGLPIALAFPPRLLSRVGWPLCLLIGATLGPLALLLMFVVLFGLQGQLSSFSLAHTESLWPLAILVSTVSFVVYAALVRRRVRRRR